MYEYLNTNGYSDSDIVAVKSHFIQTFYIFGTSFVPNREDREARFLASKMGIIATFRSWAGTLFHITL
jgi:hypothetical protein